MADNIRNSKPELNRIGQWVDETVQLWDAQRKSFERTWYDNNFFDDGHHFRFVSRTTGKVVDLSKIRGMQAPQRAIPKASRQIRGVANLLLQPDYIPIIYPEQVNRGYYDTKESYAAAQEIAADMAKNIGHWLLEEWGQNEIEDQLVQMVLLAAKNSVSYMKIWPDAVDEKINTSVRDAFEVYLNGSLTEIYDSPAIIEAHPMLIAEIKANEMFDPEQTAKLNPDNKYASSEVKDAYMRSRYGNLNDVDRTESLIVKEAFIKEYLNDDNIERIGSEFSHVLEGKKKGDMVMRHAFTAGGIALRDEYVDLDEYPFVDFRFEPGPIYQTSLIERFIPANKSLDTVMSRVERWANTMAVGHWLKRRGEDISFSNIPGGLVLEWEQSPPQQGNVTPLPNTLFNFINLLEQNIEEQGAATSALGQIPQGVKSGVAIESLKATEYANLKIPSKMLKKTVRRIARRYIDIASDHFISPQTITILEKGEPRYIDIIGERGANLRTKELKEELPNGTIVIGKDYNVDIQVESGLGFTSEGRKATIAQIAEFVRALAAEGYLTQPAVRAFMEKYLETFEFGGVREIMDALEEGEGSAPLTEQQIDQMKVAILETLEAAGVVGKEADERAVDAGKVAMAEGLSEMGAV